MATEVTETNELQIELVSDDEQYARVLRVPNPQTSLTLAEINEAFSGSVFARSGATSDTAVVGFFYDDYNPQAALTRVKSATRVVVRREATAIV